MVIGAAILNAMSHNPISASAFCLSQYYDLAPVEESLGFQAVQVPYRWKQIEIHRGIHGDNHESTGQGSGVFPEQSGTSASALEYNDAACHFIICDGYVGSDGQIQPTESWHSQFTSDRKIQDRPDLSEDIGQTIYICIATTGESTAPTDSQIMRTEALVEELCRRFRIQPGAIRYSSS